MAQDPVLRVSLTDVYGKYLNEKVDIMLRHLTLSDRVKVSADASAPIRVKGLRGQPQGLYRYWVDAPSYRPIGGFLSMLASGVTESGMPRSDGNLHQQVDQINRGNPQEQAERYREQPEDQRHDHLCDAPAQVSPPGRGRVCRPHAIGCKHHRRVILRDDERGTDRSAAGAMAGGAASVDLSADSATR